MSQKRPFLTHTNEMEKALSLIPQSKHDIECAEAAIAAGYPAVAPILPQLLEWLQDYNRPVAKVLAPFLASIGSPLIPHIRKIFETDDDIWQRWIIDCIMSESRILAEAFREELERMACSPTETHLESGLNEYAESILKKYKWIK